MNDRESQMAPIAASVVLAIAMLFTAASCTSALPSDVRFANVEGRRIAYRVLGAGQPVVVMISGLGDGMATFEDVAPELANTGTVIVYDRAGYGASDAVPGTRDAQAAERELSSVLDQSGIGGPYVLVGHSVGGLYAEYYAAEHPDEVAGLVLEDSRPSAFRRECEAAGVSMCAAPAALAWTMPVGAQSELGALGITEAQVEDIAPMTGKPVLVLSRPTPARADTFNSVWSASQNRLASRYPGARHLTAPNGGHYIHLDQKDWFVTSLRAFLDSRNADARI